MNRTAGKGCGASDEEGC